MPFGFFGVVSPDELFGASDQTLGAQTSLMARSGVESVRVTFNWSFIEPFPNVYAFASTDRYMENAARHGLVVLANVMQTPTWASSHPSGLYPYRYAPKDPQLMGTFMRALVERYGPNGTFWKLNPGLPRDPIREWQIWNEQGLDVFWATQPWPSTYVRMLRAAYTAIHRADHGAKVVAGSLVAAGPTSQWAQAASLYRAGLKRWCDVIAVHPFTDGSIPVNQSVGRVVTIVQMVRNVMREYGDGRKPIILTEVTWPAARGAVPANRLLGLETTPRGEALRLTAAYDYLATHTRQTGVSQVYWFTWASDFDRNDPQSDVGYRFAGLLRITANGAFIPQAVLGTYARAAQRYEGCRKSTNARVCG